MNADLAEAIVNRADFAALDVHLIVETAQRLDRREDQQRLHLTVAKLRSRLLILDPFRASAARRRVMCAAYLALTMQGAEAPRCLVLAFLPAVCAAGLAGMVLM